METSWSTVTEATYNFSIRPGLVFFSEMINFMYQVNLTCRRDT